MKKYVLVEVSKETVAAHLKTFDNNEFSIGSNNPTILHGKRELLEKVLEVGEFEVSYELPKKGECFITKGSDGLTVMQTSIDWQDCRELVLTNLDEPEEDEQKPIYTLNKEEVAEFTSFMLKCIKRRGGLIT